MSVVNIFKKFQSQPADDLPKDIWQSKDFVPHWMMLSDTDNIQKILYRRTEEFDENNEAEFSVDHEKAREYCWKLISMADCIVPFAQPIRLKDGKTVEMPVPKDLLPSDWEPDRVILADEDRTTIYVFQIAKESKYFLKGRVSDKPGKWGVPGLLRAE
jgi:hypothetical protein